MVEVFFTVYFRVFGEPRPDKTLQKTIDLYKEDGFNNLFSTIRVWDAPFEAINKAVPRKGNILDLGCGDGLLSNYLALSSNQRKITGIEINEDRIDVADKGIKNTKFISGNILENKLTKVDCVLLVHVLHHLPSKKDQEEMLKKLDGIISNKGRLVVVEISERPLGKHIFTWLTDSFTVPILFEGKLFDFNFHFRKDIEWIKLFNELGYKVKISHPHKGKPFSHIIFECQKS